MKSQWDLSLSVVGALAERCQCVNREMGQSDTEKDQGRVQTVPDEGSHDSLIYKNNNA